MEPSQQNNYWKHDPESDEKPEMYTPDDVVEDVDTGTEPDQIVDETSPDEEPVHWSASEYISGNKNVLWFIVFVVVILALIAGDILLLKEFTFSILIVVMAAAILIYSHRAPREVFYTLSGDQGLYIGEKLYHFNEFRAFGLIRDQGNHSIMLIPTKRFSPGISVYFPEEVGEKIVDILGARLPMETLKIDFIDMIVRKLRL